MMKKHKVDRLNNSENSKNSMKHLLFALSVLAIISITPAYADTTIEPVQGSGAPGCENTAEGCFTPEHVTVNQGDLILFENTDFSAHVFSSGDPTRPDTVQTLFDSGLVMAGGEFEWEATESTDYFCDVHPWAKGHIEVIPKPEVIPTVVTIQTDKTQYSHGDTMTFSGVASPVQEPDNRPDFVKDHSVNKVMIEIYQDEKTRSSKYLAIDEQGNYLYTTPEIEPTRHDMGTYTIKVTYLDQTVETDFDIIEWTPTYKTNPTPEPAPVVPTVPTTTPTYEELVAENQILKEKIKTLNQLVLEQLKVIVQWIQS